VPGGQQARQRGALFALLVGCAYGLEHVRIRALDWTPARPEPRRLSHLGRPDPRRTATSRGRNLRDCRGRQARTVPPRAPPPSANSTPRPSRAKSVVTTLRDHRRGAGPGPSWRNGPAYVGLPAPQAQAGAPGPPPTHKVVALRTLVFPGPSVKLQPSRAFALGLPACKIARVEAPVCGSRVRRIPAGAPSLLRSMLDDSDFVAVAERFLGVPYLWGRQARPAFGLDCSGLVQGGASPPPAAFPAPARHSDMQEQCVSDVARRGRKSQLGSREALDPTDRPTAGRPHVSEGPTFAIVRGPRPRDSRQTHFTWRGSRSRPISGWPHRAHRRGRPVAR